MTTTAKKSATKSATRATGISTSYPDRVVVRGYDLTSELMGKVSFVDYFLILLLGKRPTPELSKLLEATLVALCEHGLNPSVHAARITYSSAPNALQGAVAAGLLSCGPVVLGASEEAGRLLVDIVAETGRGATLDAAVDAQLQALAAARRPLPGFGHRQHRDGDPRARRLVEMARELGTAGPHVAALEALERRHKTILGRSLPVNVTGAIPAVLLDAGFPAEVLKGVPLVARSAGLIAHILEESQRPIGFHILDTGAETVVYDGPDHHAEARS